MVVWYKYQPSTEEETEMRSQVAARQQRTGSGPPLTVLEREEKKRKLIARLEEALRDMREAKKPFALN